MKQSEHQLPDSTNYGITGHQIFHEFRRYKHVEGLFENWYKIFFHKVTCCTYLVSDFLKCLVTGLYIFSSKKFILSI